MSVLGRTEADTTVPALGKAFLVGLVGRGIQLSRTPWMHESEGAALGLRYIYKLIDTEHMNADIAQIVSLAQDFGFSGLNLTYPYKQDVTSQLDELSEAARAVGSVNTVVFRDGRRFGHNTDIWGFREAFRLQMQGVATSRVLLVGAGGAGVAVARALLDLGVGELFILDVDQARAAELADRLCGQFGRGRAVAVRDPLAAGPVDGLVNATPVGMQSKPGLPVDAALLHAGMWVGDIIYFPIETALLKTARALGCRTMDGAGMAVFQAVRAFELFTGIKPDIERMKAAFAAFDR